MEVERCCLPGAEIGDVKALRESAATKVDPEELVCRRVLLEAADRHAAGKYFKDWRRVYIGMRKDRTVADIAAATGHCQAHICWMRAVIRRDLRKSLHYPAAIDMAEVAPRPGEGGTAWTALGYVFG